MDATIREGGMEDWPVLAEFNARLARETEALELDRPTLERGVRAALADRSKAIYFVAEAEGKVIGQLMITHEWSDWRNGDIWWIQSVYVEAAWRRRGIFTSLYRHVRQAAQAQGAVGLRLYVEPHNGVGIETYRQLGMRDAGYRVMEAIWRQ
ncbi:MAG TPA: GNAT family N-acetyltransferase [Tepidisphaeraceae bacterium]|jgi:ribosomal protein S18 acetylase RimI-like enzyme